MFHEEEFEIYVGESNTVTIYLWNVEKIQVWQAAADFESTNIIACYGFGGNMLGAHMHAQKLLQLRVEEANVINEEPVVYEVS